VFKYNVNDWVFCDLRHKGLGCFTGHVLTRNNTGLGSVTDGTANEYEVTFAPWIIEDIQRVLVWEEEMSYATPIATEK
jgi:hypothetical protein